MVDCLKPKRSYSSAAAAAAMRSFCDLEIDVTQIA